MHDTQSRLSQLGEALLCCQWPSVLVNKLMLASKLVHLVGKRSVLSQHDCQAVCWAHVEVKHLLSLIGWNRFVLSCLSMNVELRSPKQSPVSTTVLFICSSKSLPFSSGECFRASFTARSCQSATTTTWLSAVTSNSLCHAQHTVKVYMGVASPPRV